MLEFRSFRPSPVSTSEVKALIEATRASLAASTDITRICLDPAQTTERSLLEQMGFACDGIEYSADVERLTQALAHRAALPAGFEIRTMDFDADIDAVVALERSVHAADPSSRVNFDTVDAIDGMRAYYKRASGDQGAFLRPAVPGPRAALPVHPGEPAPVEVR